MTSIHPSAPPTHCGPLHPYHLHTQRMEPTDLDHENDTMFSYKNNSGLADPYEIGTYIVGSSFPTLNTDPSYLGNQAALKLAAGLNSSCGNTVILKGNTNMVADDAHAARLYTNSYGGQIIRTKEPIYTTPAHNTVIMSRAGPEEDVSGTRHMTRSHATVRNFKEYEHESHEDSIARIRGHQLHRPILSNHQQHSFASGFAPSYVGVGVNPMRPTNSAQVIFSKN